MRDNEMLMSFLIQTNEGKGMRTSLLFPIITLSLTLEPKL